MKSLSKQQQAQLADFKARLAAAAAEVETAYAALADRVRDAWEETADMPVAAYNDLVEEFNTFREEVESELQDCYDNRSDAWQESERGETFLAWIDAWGDAPDELSSDPPDTPDAPEVRDYPISVEDV
jgi:hypothetical protein